jgi:hypothetical protein
MKRCSRHDGVHIHGCPGCIADQRDRSLLAMRKFAELEECLVWVMNEREWAAATYHDLGYYVWLSEIVECYRGARGRVLAAFRDGDVEAALKAMGVNDG